jgi:hypothetical protein
MPGWNNGKFAQSDASLRPTFDETRARYTSRGNLGEGLSSLYKPRLHHRGGGFFVVHVQQINSGDEHVRIFS